MTPTDFFKDVVRDRLTMDARRKLAHRRVRLRQSTAALRAMPDMLIIGAQRSGTSSLYRYLGSHPDLFPSLRKETQYFSTSYHMNEEWYRAHFPISARLAGHRIKGRSAVAFEATPDYLFHPVAPLRVKNDLPNVKLIVLLRDPVDRAVSHHGHMARLNLEPLRFEDAVAAEPTRIANSMAGLEGRIDEDPVPALRYSYVARGRYVEQLKRWLSVFDRSAFHFVDFDFLTANPARCVIEICHFLGVREYSPREFRNYSIRSGEQRATPESGISPTLRQELNEYFRNENEGLRDLTRHEFGWM